MMVRRPALVLLVFGLVLLPLVWAGFRLQIDRGPDAILDGDQRTRDAYAMVEDALERQVVIIVSMECERVFDRDNLTTMRDLSEAFLDEPGVIDVKSFTHSSIPARKGLGFTMLPFLGGDLEDLSDEELAEREKFSLEHPLVRNLMLSADGRHATIGVTYAPGHFSGETQDDITEWRQRVDALLERFASDDVRFTWLSLPSAQNELLGILSADLKRFGIALGSVLALWLIAFFRTWRMLLFGIGCVLMFAPLVPGMLVALQITPAAFSLVVFPLLGAILLTMVAHVTHAFRSALADGLEVRDAAEQALGEIARSTALAALTTAIGMGSFALSGLEQASEFGWLGAIGVLLALAVVLGPGISLLVLAHAGLRQPLAIRNPGRVRLKNSWRRPLLAGLLLLLAAAAAGWWQRPTEIKITDLLPEESETRRAAESLEDHYQGIQFLKIGIDSGEESGIRERAFLDYLMALQEKTEAMEGVSAVYSYAGVMAMMNQVWNGWKPGSYRLPKQGFMLAAFDTALRSARFPFTHALHDSDRQVAWMFVRLNDLPARKAVELVGKLEGIADENRPPGVEARLAEGLHRFIEAEAKIEKAQWRTLGATLLITGIFLALWWRSAVLALIAIAFVAAPTFGALGLAGWLSVPLNSITFMVAALVIGIGLDDVVHWLGYWRELRRRGLANPEAIQRTQEVKGHPILLTSILLVAVFLAFGIMHFPPLIHFGWTAAGALTGAVSLLLLGMPQWLRNRDSR